MLVLAVLLMVAGVAITIVSIRRLARLLRLYVETHKTLPNKYSLLRRHDDPELETHRRLRLAGLAGAAMFALGILVYVVGFPTV